MRHRNRVCVWREELLPSSETFILNQARALRRWTALVSGIRASPGGLQVTPDFTVEGDGRIAHRVDRWIYWRLGTSPRLQRHLASSSVIHAHFGPDGTRVVRAARLARRPLVVTFHGYDVTMPPAGLGVDYSGLFAHADRLIAVSQFVRGRLLQAGAPEDKVAVVPIGIPLPPDPGPPGDARQLLYVGRLVPKKGCNDLLTALGGMSDAPPLLVIGDGPLRADLERLAHSLRVDATFAGARDPAYVARAMSDSIALCVPSQESPSGDQEGLGMVFLEAAAHRLPVVSYVSGGVPEAVANGETGLLAPEGDVPMLAQHLSAVTGDPELAERLGAAGRRRVAANFDIRACTADLELLYDRVAGEVVRRKR